MSFTLAARVPDDMLEPLNFLSKHMQRSKSFLMGEALRRYIAEQMEEIAEMSDIAKDTEKLLARKNSDNRLYSSDEALEFIMKNCKS